MLQNETLGLIFKHCAYFGMFVCCLLPLFHTVVLISLLTQNVQFSITLMINVKHLYQQGKLLNHQFDQQPNSDFQLMTKLVAISSADALLHIFKKVALQSSYYTPGSPPPFSPSSKHFLYCIPFLLGPFIPLIVLLHYK